MIYRWMFLALGISALPPACPAKAGPPAFAAQKVLVVSPNQPGAWHTVGAAINHALGIAGKPGGSASPVIIFIKPGIYHERLRIPADAPPMELIGENPLNTVIAAARIAYDRNSHGRPVGMWKTATLRVDADHFSAINLTFANFGGQGGPGYNRMNGQALAVRIDGHDNAFYHCRFQSWQDTLLVNRGRNYFEDCRITGTTDFIFGAGTAWFQRCRIHCLGRGFITAAKTPAASRFGLVFNRCRITAASGADSVLLGRPWGTHAKVLFLRTWMSSAVQPRGWITWHHNPRDKKTVEFAEYKSTGPGAWPAARAAWSRQLTGPQIRGVGIAAVVGGKNRWHPRRTIQQQLIPDWLRLTVPHFGRRVCSIITTGAAPNSRGLSTAAIQRAIDRTAAAGGGEVLIPRGRFVTGPLTLQSGINLHLARGAELAFSRRHADFPVHRHWYTNCISAVYQSDIAITGHGVIDGGGASWWKLYRKARPGGPPSMAAGRLPHRPYLILLAHCRHILIRDVTLQNSPMCNLVMDYCDDAVVRGVRILAPPHSPNTDGMDPSGHNYLISHCTFDEGDDCIAIKSGGRPHRINAVSQNMLITHCLFRHGHGMSIGSGSSGGLNNITVLDCRFHGTQAGIRMKADGRDGGLADNLVYRRLTMTGVIIPILISSYYNDTSPWAYQIPPRAFTASAGVRGPHTPVWRHIRISHVTATNADTAGFIVGRPESPARDIVLRDVRINARHPMQLLHAHVLFRHCAVSVARPAAAVEPVPQKHVKS